MPNPNASLIAVVLDRSGSMAPLVESTLAGLNTFIDAQRKLPCEVRLHLVQFDHEFLKTYDFAPLLQVKELTTNDYQPRGNTALYDAIGRTINEVGARLASMPESSRPGKVVVVIQTDGLENASREYSSHRIQEMISHQREKYGWEFVFLGANQDAVASAGALGISARAAITYGANPIAVRSVFLSTSNAVGDYMKGAAVNACYNAQDRADAMQGNAVPKKP